MCWSRWWASWKTSSISGRNLPLPAAGGGLLLDGSASLRDLVTQLHWKFPREAGVETLAGFLLAQLGHIPVAGESVEFERAAV